MPFPNKVNYTWPIGFPGRLASANPFRSVVPPRDGFRAGAGGLTVAAFAWAQPDGTLLNAGNGLPTGFVPADQQGLTTAYLEESTMTVPAGFMTNLVSGGDFYAISTVAANVGDIVYASTTTGAITTGASGSSGPTGYINTTWTVSYGGAAGDPIIITGPFSAVG